VLMCWRHPWAAVWGVLLHLSVAHTSSIAFYVVDKAGLSDAQAVLIDLGGGLNKPCSSRDLVYGERFVCLLMTQFVEWLSTQCAQPCSV